jgi:hypothetical protein
MPASRLPKLERQVPPTGAAAHWLARLRRNADLAAHGRCRGEDGTRERHPGARMLSIMAAASSISRLSSSSASNAATSAANTARRLRRLALSRIARRIASDRLAPVASSCLSARIASSSRRTLIADDIALVYHNLSYILPAEQGPSKLVMRVRLSLVLR